MKIIFKKKTRDCSDICRNEERKRKKNQKKRENEKKKKKKKRFFALQFFCLLWGGLLRKERQRQSGHIVVLTDAPSVCQGDFLWVVVVVVVAQVSKPINLPSTNTIFISLESAEIFFNKYYGNTAI